GAPRRWPTLGSSSGSGTVRPPSARSRRRRRASPRGSPRWRTRSGLACEARLHRSAWPLARRIEPPPRTLHQDVAEAVADQSRPGPCRDAQRGVRVDTGGQLEEHQHVQLARTGDVAQLLQRGIGLLGALLLVALEQRAKALQLLDVAEHRRFRSQHLPAVVGVAEPERLAAGPGGPRRGGRGADLDRLRAPANEALELDDVAAEPPAQVLAAGLDAGPEERVPGPPGQRLGIVEERLVGAAQQQQGVGGVEVAAVVEGVGPLRSPVEVERFQRLSPEEAGVAGVEEGRAVAWGEGQGAVVEGAGLVVALVEVGGLGLEEEGVDLRQVGELVDDG